MLLMADYATCSTFIGALILEFMLWSAYGAVKLRFTTSGANVEPLS